MKLAFVFPGQGSQSVGMMQAWEGRAEVRQTFAEASDALGLDIWQLVSVGPAEVLNQTINTQPAMLAADVAVWRVWRAAGGKMPMIMAGHSLGEYAALVAADALDFSDTIRLVRFRAQAMQDAVPDAADLIDIGSHGVTTFQLYATLPVRIYVDMLIAQVSFWKPLGDIELYKGKYQNSTGPQPSMTYKDFL